jgi:hypothetical protein
MSFEMGRPVVLRSEETDCPYPSVSEADEFELIPPIDRLATGGEQDGLKTGTHSKSILEHCQPSEYSLE